MNVVYVIIKELSLPKVHSKESSVQRVCPLKHIAKIYNTYCKNQYIINVSSIPTCSIYVSTRFSFRINKQAYQPSELKFNKAADPFYRKKWEILHSL